MCMIDDSDGQVTMLRDGKYVTAKKQHKCAECHRFIEQGERYHVETYKFDGAVTTHKTCAHCMVARDWLQDECGGSLYGAIEEDIREHCFSRVYRMDLYRVAVGMSWCWRTPSGRLLPVPKAITTSDEITKAEGRA